MFKIIEENILSEDTLEALECLFHLQIGLGATDRLIKHHEVTINTAIRIVNSLPEDLQQKLDIKLLLSGTSVHDVAKAIHINELSEEGRDHEFAGQAILVFLGVSEEIAEFCISDTLNSIEKVISLISDRIWTGTRSLHLESNLTEMVSIKMGWDYWETYQILDKVFEEVAVDSFQNYKDYITKYSY